jgi:CBS domain-containing protein
MVTAKDMMTKEVVTFSPGTEIVHAARILLELGLNGAPVLDERGKVVGILCQSDLIAQQKKLPVPSVFTLLDSWFPLKPTHMEKAFRRIAAITVSDAMTRNPMTIRPDTAVDEIAALMVDRNFHTLPVVDEEGKLVGVVGKRDILKTLLPE